MIARLMYIGAPFLFLPHILLFLCSKKKAIISADLYARKSKNKNVVLDLAYELMINKYFRNLFYFRCSNGAAKLIRVFYPQVETFIIDVNTKIGEGLRLAHPYATILNAERIGKNVYVNHLVTLGEKNGKRPIIEDNVELHANATVIGGITIGEGAIIGAGAVVVKDVPSGAVIVGNPGRTIN